MSRSPRRWRPALEEEGSLLEGVGQLQHPEIVLMAPNDLETHGQTFRREAAGDRIAGSAVTVT